MYSAMHGDRVQLCQGEHAKIVFVICICVQDFDVNISIGVSPQQNKKKNQHLSLWIQLLKKESWIHLALVRH
jgi:hypothetical protein